MTNTVSVDKRVFKGNTLIWMTKRFVYSLFFSAIATLSTILMTLLLIPIASKLPHGLTIYILFAVLTGISSGEVLTQYKIQFSLPDTKNIFRPEMAEKSGNEGHPTNKLIVGLMVAGGTNGIFLIVLVLGALVHFVSPLGSLAVPIMTLYIDRYLFEKYGASLTFGGANLIKWILKQSSTTGRDLKRMDMLYSVAQGLLTFSKGAVESGNVNYS